jgi:hypothetical protein
VAGPGIVEGRSRLSADALSDDDNAAAAPVTVLYVAGWMYSGSTLLGRVLGELDGAFAGGEITRAWSGFVRERPCSCGVSRRECPLWTAVLADACGRVEALDAARVDRLARRFRFNRRAATTQLALHERGPAVADLAEYREHLASLYRSIVRVTGARVVVDTTKSPVYGAILDGIAGLDVRVVHLVRDPRASLRSGSERGHSRIGPAANVSLWALSHLAIEREWARRPEHYRRVRYEDFARRPQEVSEALARFAGLDPRTLPIDGTHIVLGESHVVSGNEYSGVETGPVEIAPDEAWRRELSRAGYLGATALIWPLLRRYGYGLGR